MRDLAERLVQIPSVRRGHPGRITSDRTHRDDSDWDFGLYYRGTIDADDVRALRWSGQTFAAGDWGRLVNGGASGTARRGG